MADEFSPELRASTVVTATRTHTVDLSAGDIRWLLRKFGLDLPTSASVTFTVPGGGDWSNEVIEVSRETPITVRWTEHSETRA